MKGTIFFILFGLCMIGASYFADYGEHITTIEPCIDDTGAEFIDELCEGKEHTTNTKMLISVLVVAGIIFFALAMRYLLILED